ncbi:uncharacterized protein LODBEIA_P56020 [Lodderomyces beijingensis]|uniref:Uncharacterized protein n=1 Tax=Lodderomyces beijingensis TaxID=1775926 RepID=A0ABP0ZTB7_9ASCO
MEEPAPYGGFIVKSIEDEKANAAELEQLSVEVQYQGTTQQIRPEALHLNGVDNLSTEEIKAYVDYYLNYTSEFDNDKQKITYSQIPFEDQLTFRVEWIDDSNVNVVFKTSHENRNALAQLRSEPMTNDANDVNKTIQEVLAKPYDPIVAFRKSQSLVNRLALANGEADKKAGGGGNADGNGNGNGEGESKMDEDESAIELRIRQSFQSDRKVKNASQYSRYYLIHGEPERQPRRRYAPRRRDTEEKQEQEDLFADKLKKSQPVHDRRGDDDLFRERLASKGRGRGDGDDDLFKSKVQNRRGRRNDGGDEEEEDLFAEKLKKRTRSRSPTRPMDGTGHFWVR